MSVQLPKLKLENKLTVEERNKIIEIYSYDDVRCFNHDDPEDKDDYLSNYFILQLDEQEAEDQFYDHSVVFDKIFKELGLVCTGFQPNNDFYKKGDWNPYFGVWFSRLEQETQSENRQP